MPSTEKFLYNKIILYIVRNVYVMLKYVCEGIGNATYLSKNYYFKP